MPDPTGNPSTLDELALVLNEVLQLAMPTWPMKQPNLDVSRIVKGLV
jgi:hypothetical protein